MFTWVKSQVVVLEVNKNDLFMPLNTILKVSPNEKPISQQYD